MKIKSSILRIAAIATVYGIFGTSAMAEDQCDLTSQCQGAVWPGSDRLREQPIVIQCLHVRQ